MYKSAQQWALVSNIWMVCHLKKFLTGYIKRQQTLQLVSTAEHQVSTISIYAE